MAIENTVYIDFLIRVRSIIDYFSIATNPLWVNKTVDIVEGCLLRFEYRGMAVLWFECMSVAVLWIIIRLRRMISLSLAYFNQSGLVGILHFRVPA